jgi:predicted DsbA family dithiol-disulfide isomerase
LKKLEQSTDIAIRWRSFELRPAGSPPLPPEYRARIEAGRPRLVALARDQFGVELNQGPFGINSRPALVGAKFAEAHGQGAAYHDAVFRAYWQHARPIDDPRVLTEIAGDVGLDPAAFLAALDAPEFQEAVDSDVAQAHAYGLTGVPAHIFNDRYLVSGAQPYPTLLQVYEQVAGETG